ncbi:unnamed protein product [Lepeophtheirus salmonis]|uniref:(salmon louse) hypothetical protein n=1 Tax=Lepeophtheirus salmonis TaxID=72036 RepID=A0A7R8H294_LEPSM|nr:unnamed protein product [Lepeophtheirus salmonis]CAF2820586.1 unnamed protein product [Lepeophtheirus salmonis]
MKSVFILFLSFWFIYTDCSSSIQLDNNLRIYDENMAIYNSDSINVNQLKRNKRRKRSGKTISNEDIREAIMQLITLDGTTISLKKKIDHMSTFLLRMKHKLDFLERVVKQNNQLPQANGKTEKNDLQTIAAESFDILSLLPTYIENIQKSCSNKVKELGNKINGLEYFLIPDKIDETYNVTLSINATNDNGIVKKRNLHKVLQSTEHNIIKLYKEIKGISNVEKILLDSADGVIDTKRKLEFGIRQIIFKVSELADILSRKIDVNISEKIDRATQRIFENQNAAMGNLTKKVENEIGHVWRQMGIMYGQVSNSISILQKVKDQTEIYVNHTGKNLGEMEGTVEGLTDSMVTVDTNLNYMLGQLSLVVTEFNQVKSGLTNAMSTLEDNLDDIESYENIKLFSGELLYGVERKVIEVQAKQEQIDDEMLKPYEFLDFCEIEWEWIRLNCFDLVGDRCDSS